MYSNACAMRSAASVSMPLPEGVSSGSKGLSARSFHSLRASSSDILPSIIAPYGAYNKKRASAEASRLERKRRPGFFLCYYASMKPGLADIVLEVRGGDIIVDLPGTSYTVTYHKPAVSPQLLATYLPAKDDPRTEMTQAKFLARAWSFANDRARELGWIS